MLNKVKLALRISGNAFDDELTDLIEACKADLKQSGVEVVIKTDPLIIQAVKLYCKANFGDNDTKDRFLNAYTALKISLSLSGDYHE